MRRSAAIAAFASAALCAAPARLRPAPLALGNVPLVDQSGSPFRLRELAGRATAITFVATRCRETCPIVNAVFATIAHDPGPARLLTVSLDPAYDTPIVIANFARALQARAPVWRFATGRPADVARVLAAFGVTVDRGADGIPDAHSNFIYVLDRSGRLQTTLPLSSHSVPDLRKALAGEHRVLLSPT